MAEPLKLYIKLGCPWCIRAQQYLDSRRYQYETVDVNRDPVAFDEMIRLSGQTLAPTLTVDGKILADFGPDDLDRFLKSERILP